MLMNIKEQTDATSYLNFGFLTQYNYFHAKLLPNEFSSMTDYPHSYKFYSVHVELNQDKQFIDRSTYDLLRFSSEFAGLAIFLLRSLQFLTGKFGRLSLDALITSRLYYVSQDLKDHLQQSTIFKNPVFGTLATGELNLTIPKMIDLKYLNYICNCCKKQK